jgi:hypothetical protein
LKGAKEIFPSRKYKMEYYERDQVAVLLIGDVDHGDSGRYKCEVANNHGRTDTSCRLTVYGMNQSKPLRQQV